MKKVKVKIRDLTATGEGIASSDEGVLFVDEALPDEEVSCSIIQKKKNYSKGKLLEILIPSALRVDPPCQYFKVCGGCSLQHADYKLQLQVKEKRVKDAFVKIAKEPESVVKMIVPSPKTFGYRNKVTLPLLQKKGEKKLGFFKKRSHDIVDVDSCLLHIPFADEIYKKVKDLLLKSKVSFYDEERRKGVFQHLVLRSSSKESKVLVGLIGLSNMTKEIEELCLEIGKIEEVKGVVYGKKSKASNSIYPESEIVVCGEGTLKEEILGVSINISLLSFFQVNKECAELLYNHAYNIANLSSGDKVLDAYCGIGSFALFCAKQGCSVTGIEVFPKSIFDAKQNALDNDLKVEFIEGEVEKKIHRLDDFDAVFINPPRKGVHSEVIKSLASKKIKKIIYTSCDPATLARDVKEFTSLGYTLKSAKPFDMFPQTMHVETIAFLEKNDC